MMSLSLAQLWHDLAAVPVPIVEKFLRPIAVYIFLLALVRVFGKRELAQLNPFDLIVLLCLSNTVQNAMIGEDNSLVGGMIGATALVGMNYLVVQLLFRHKKLDTLVTGAPTELIKNGALCHDALASEMVTENELLAILRRQNFSSFAEVETCTLEPNGAFTIVARHPTPGEQEQQALEHRLDGIRDEIAALRRDIAALAKN